jgi:hypothetical protein
MINPFLAFLLKNKMVEVIIVRRHTQIPDVKEETLKRF